MILNMNKLKGKFKKKRLFVSPEENSTSEVAKRTFLSMESTDAYFGVLPEGNLKKNLGCG
jgi:hypothetical protein